MLQKTGNIWKSEVDVICVTTNGVLRGDGETGIMGAGIAKEARDKLPGAEKVLGRNLRKGGNHLSILGMWMGKVILAFPTKDHWRQSSSLGLIHRSAHELREWADARHEKMGRTLSYGLPKPGCGHGGLQWETVQPILETALGGDNFIIFERGPVLAVQGGGRGGGGRI